MPVTNNRRTTLQQEDKEMTNTEKRNIYTDLHPTIKVMLGDSETFETEEQVFHYLKRYKKLLGPPSRVFDEGGTVSEVLARIAEYVEHDAVVAREAGRERGRAWAGDQQSWDPKWVSLDIHSSEAVCVEVNTCDLAYSLRDRENGASTEEHVNAFLEGAQEYFRQQE